MNDRTDTAPRGRDDFVLRIPDRIAGAGWKSGDVLLGEYEVVGQLGVGGMGRVHLVRSSVDGRELAVKHLRDPETGSLSGLLDEVRLWIDLPPHECVVRCHFVRTVADELAVFSEFCPGGTLRDRLVTLPEPSTSNSRRSNDRRADVLGNALRIAAGLEHLHACGLVHLDVKPENVLFDESGRPKLSDLGLTQQYGAVFGTRRGGTLPYCSPEIEAALGLGPPEVQATLGPTPAADVWSFGALLLEMLLGRRVWRDSAELRSVLFGLQTRPDPRVSARLLDFVQRCLSTDPDDRWTDGSQLYRELRKIRGPDGDSDHHNPLQRRRPAAPPKSGASPDVRPTRVAWKDPSPWVGTAARVAGISSPRASRLLRPRSRSIEGRLAGDLATYYDVRRLLEAAAASGDRGAQRELVSLYLDMAGLHDALRDHLAVERDCEAAIRLCDALEDAPSVDDDGADDNGVDDVVRRIHDVRAAHIDRARARETMARAVARLGRYDESVRLVDQAIATYRTIGMHGAREAIARASTRHAELLHDAGIVEKARYYIGLALSLYGTDGSAPEEPDEARRALAVAHLVKSSMDYTEGLYANGARSSRRSIAILEALRGQAQHMVPGKDTARARTRLGMNLLLLGDPDGARQALEDALDEYGHTALREGGEGSGLDVAFTHLHLGEALSMGGSREAALQQLERSMKVAQELVRRGVPEAVQAQALACAARAKVVRVGGDRDGALVGAAEGLALLRRRVTVGATPTLLSDLAHVLSASAAVLLDAGEAEQAEEQLQEAVQILEGLSRSCRTRRLDGRLSSARLDLQRAREGR